MTRDGRPSLENTMLERMIKIIIVVRPFAKGLLNFPSNIRVPKEQGLGGKCTSALAGARRFGNFEITTG